MALVKLLKVSSGGRARQHDSTADELKMLTGQFGNIKLASNSITSENTDGNINLDPNGNGLVQINSAYTLPGADGTINQILSTNGSGTLSFVEAFASKVSNSYTADEALSAVDCLYISAADNVSKADASAAATSGVIGFAEASAIDTGSVNVISEGVLGGFVGLTAGDEYFLSETAGAITATPPSNDEASIVSVGFAKSATELHINIDHRAEVDTD